MKRIIKEYFTFSKKERIAVIILLFLIVAFLTAPYFFEKEKKKLAINTQLQEQLEKLQQDDALDSLKKQESFIDTNAADVNNATLFVFDPNTIDAIGWKKLGLRDKTIATILNYRNKGGKFKNAEDIRKIWGMQQEEADRLMPFIQIVSSINQDSFNRSKNIFSQKKSINTPVDINTASVEDLMQLPGINRSLPYRIINYRDKIGSFVSLQQIKTTYGMTDSIYQSILPFLKIDMNTIKKININTASEYELSLNPYISRDISKAIVIYRNQHGNYQSIEQLKKIVFINEEMYQKILPYLTINL
jgi:competence ComEA-like helix-hairpin-helix protein